MQALTEIAPWGSAIIRPEPLKAKWIENRMWAPPRSLIGSRIAIHQGKQFDEDAYDAVRDILEDFAPMGELPLGAFLGTVLLFGYVHVEGKSIEVRTMEKVSSNALSKILGSPWRNAEATHLWLLKDPRALAAPIPCRGMQKLWNVPPEHLPALEALGGARRPPFAWTEAQRASLVTGARVVSWRFDIPREHAVLGFDEEGRVILDGVTGGHAPLEFCDPETVASAP
jgi:hypothetical protein